jgi:CDP-diacylglycerol--glycerol-3-phosphate 3-phosphatidyltransferase
MPLLQPSTLPNAITMARVLMAPAIFLLVFVPGFWSRLLAFALFLAAALSDLWDGYLARKHGWISDFGKLMDPLADKLLLVATLIPFYVLSHADGPVGELPFIGALPLWVLAVIFGREILITVVRALAARRGQVIPAGVAGKRKAVFQNIFSGSVLFWYALADLAHSEGWSGPLWRGWTIFHGSVILTTLIIAVALTVYSMMVYLHGWRRLLREVT